MKRAQGGYERRLAEAGRRWTVVDPGVACVVGVPGHLGGDGVGRGGQVGDDRRRRVGRPDREADDEVVGVRRYRLAAHVVGIAATVGQSTYDRRVDGRPGALEGRGHRVVRYAGRRRISARRLLARGETQGCLSRPGRQLAARRRVEPERWRVGVRVRRLERTDVRCGTQERPRRVGVVEPKDKPALVYAEAPIGQAIVVVGSIYEGRLTPYPVLLLAGTGLERVEVEVLDASPPGQGQGPVLGVVVEPQVVVHYGLLARVRYHPTVDLEDVVRCKYVLRLRLRPVVQPVHPPALFPRRAHEPIHRVHGVVEDVDASRAALADLEHVAVVDRPVLAQLLDDVAEDVGGPDQHGRDAYPDHRPAEVVAPHSDVGASAVQGDRVVGAVDALVVVDVGVPVARLGLEVGMSHEAVSAVFVLKGRPKVLDTVVPEDELAASILDVDARPCRLETVRACSCLVDVHRRPLDRDSLRPVLYGRGEPALHLYAMGLAPPHLDEHVLDDDVVRRLVDLDPSLARLAVGADDVEALDAEVAACDRERTPRGGGPSAPVPVGDVYDDCVAPEVAEGNVVIGVAGSCEVDVVGQGIGAGLHEYGVPRKHLVGRPLDRCVGAPLGAVARAVAAAGGNVQRPADGGDLVCLFPGRHCRNDRTPRHTVDVGKGHPDLVGGGRADHQDRRPPLVVTIEARVRAADGAPAVRRHCHPLYPPGRARLPILQQGLVVSVRVSSEARVHAYRLVCLYQLYRQPRRLVTGRRQRETGIEAGEPGARAYHHQQEGHLEGANESIRSRPVSHQLHAHASHRGYAIVFVVGVAEVPSPLFPR